MIRRYHRLQDRRQRIGKHHEEEGIMMRHKDEYAVAVRKPDGEICVEKDTYKSIIKWKR